MVTCTPGQAARHASDKSLLYSSLVILSISDDRCRIGKKTYFRKGEIAKDKGVHLFKKVNGKDMFERISEQIGSCIIVMNMF